MSKINSPCCHNPIEKDKMKHHVVFLEAANAPHLDLCFPHTCQRYNRTEPQQVASRIKDATIVVAGVIPITAGHLDQAPQLRCLAITASAYEWLDRQAFAERGITVLNSPHNNVQAVGEHFVALYFAARRKVVEVHNAITGAGRRWIQEGSLTSLWTQGPPLGCQQETLGIIGYGALGRKIEELARALGFGRILIAERKGQRVIRDGRVAFQELIESATTIVVCCPKEQETLDLISELEIRAMRQETLLLNLSRGSIINEHALADALKEHRIFGAATDVLETEPAGMRTTPLIPDVSNAVPNLTVSAHVAWFSHQTMENLRRSLKLSIEDFVMGDLLRGSVIGTVIIHQGTIYR